jgi:hypothetical protein
MKETEISGEEMGFYTQENLALHVIELSWRAMESAWTGKGNLKGLCVQTTLGQNGDFRLEMGKGTFEYFRHLAISARRGNELKIRFIDSSNASAMNLWYQNADITYLQGHPNAITPIHLASE